MDQNGTAVNNVRARGLALAFVGAAIVLGAAHWHVRSPASRLLPSGDRRAVPNLSETLLDGSAWTLADQRGRIVLINYWATWCAPCQEEMPALSRIVREQAHAGVEVLGISLDKGDGAPARVREFVTRFGVSYPVAIGETTLNSASDTIGIPNTLLVDRKGRLAKVYAGPISSGDVEGDLRALSREQ